ncbi:MAG: addiction module protein [Candidatus Manganitrophus sp.]|nr:addiction module protein [Candidatus Manganitrophus sp.]MDC4223660.1 addiction module protein [Candidatus Manganitrophus sp.]WDT70058.1 MAG: addiction module protein [Candidatus Manganitrophus sp.]WDT73729.1 MAG: addiction module protein [Candidatus Manganitrophus sp.]WDT78290.1 MAG: addiction module protein [Candidatus Manganitrophus sp.]
MGAKDILEKALKLKPQDKLTVVEGLLKSLDEPDKDIDQIWAEEAEKRLDAYRRGGLEGIPMEEIFSEE